MIKSNKKNKKSKYLNLIKKHLKEVLRTKKSPHSISMGIAIGTLIGTLPIPLIDFFIAFWIILLFKKINKYALMLAVAFWNPITKIPILIYSYKIGNILFANAPIVNIEIPIMNLIYTYTKRFIIGNVLISIILTVGIYFLSYMIVMYIQRNKKTKKDIKRRP